MEQAALEPGAAPQQNARRALDIVLRFQSVFGLIVIVVLAAILSPVRDGSNVFLEPRNLLNIVRFASENGIIAIGVTLVILTGGIDLSVGAVLALCAVGAAAFMTRYELGTAPTVLLVLALGGFVGIVNGLVTTRFNIQSFITTLAMLGVARGVASLWSGGYAIPLAFGEGEGLAPASFKAIFGGQVSLFGLEVPAPVFYFLGVGVIASFLLRRTGFGRHVYAVGGNETAARLSGVNVDRVKVIVFAVSGLLAGLAALLHAALPARFLLTWREGDRATEGLHEPHLERAIGVIYRPETERMSHYFRARLPDQFDAVLHFDETRAVRPLEVTAEWEAGEPPETFPFGV